MMSAKSIRSWAVPAAPTTIAALAVLTAAPPPAGAVVPEYTVGEGGVTIAGVSPDSPIIYDNDWWFDVFDNNYLWAQASRGAADLRGNVVSRDMWDHRKGYLYPMQKCLDDAAKAVAVARASGLRHIPDPVAGAAEVLAVPASGRVGDTVFKETPGSRLIAEQALLASPEKPLVVVAGGPITTVANALLARPEAAPNMVVFALTVSHNGYNGKDAWSAHVVAKRTRLVEWATRSFWDKGSVFGPEHFDRLPDNPFCDEMKRFIRTDLGRANQLGDGAPLVWLFDHRCWTGATVRSAVWRGGPALFLTDGVGPGGEGGDVLDIPKSATDLARCREEYFRPLLDPKTYGIDR